MYPLLVENMTDEEAYIQNLNIEVNSKEVYVWGKFWTDTF